MKERLEAENVEASRRDRRVRRRGGPIGGMVAVLRRVGQVAATDANVLIWVKRAPARKSSRMRFMPAARARSASSASTAPRFPPPRRERVLRTREGRVHGSHGAQARTLRARRSGHDLPRRDRRPGTDLQAKLLRVLQHGEFERLGSTHTIKVDARVIAATNRDLARAMSEGKFRDDLYYRLNVFPIHLPPLRQRRDDIALLVWHFIGLRQGKLGKRIERVPQRTMQALIDYAWPGNARELENVIERALILSPGDTLILEDALVAPSGSAHALPAGSGAEAPMPPTPTLTEAERELILRTLELCGGRITGRGNAAERLGVNPSTLRSRMKKLGIGRAR